MSSASLTFAEPLYYDGYYRVIFDGEVYDLKAYNINGNAILGNATCFDEASNYTGYSLPIMSNENATIGTSPIVPFCIIGDGDAWSNSSDESGGTRAPTRNVYGGMLYAEEGNHTIEIIRLQADIKPIDSDLLPMLYLLDPYSGNDPQEVSIVDIFNMIFNDLNDTQDVLYVDTKPMWIPTNR